MEYGKGIGPSLFHMERGRGLVDWFALDYFHICIIANQPVNPHAHAHAHAHRPLATRGNPLQMKSCL